MSNDLDYYDELIIIDDTLVCSDCCADECICLDTAWFKEKRYHDLEDKTPFWR